MYFDIKNSSRPGRRAATNNFFRSVLGRFSFFYFDVIIKLFSCVPDRFQQQLSSVLTFLKCISNLFLCIETQIFEEGETLLVDREDKLEGRQRDKGREIEKTIQKTARK
jgi:hypothetical protein